MTKLTVEGVSKAFSGKPILREISFGCDAGQTYVLMGGSGTGKTTLLRIIAGLETADTGSVGYGQSGQKTISYMPQGDSLFPWQTIEDNILLPLRVGTQRKPMIEARDRDRMKSLLHRFDIAGTENMHPRQLSGGMRQRVALARSLMTQPQLLLMDEPFSALDEAVRHRIESDITEFIREAGIIAVFVTHNVDQALAMGDTIAFLEGHPAMLSGIVPIQRGERPLSPERYGKLRSRLLKQIHAG